MSVFQSVYFTRFVSVSLFQSVCFSVCFERFDTNIQISVYFSGKRARACSSSNRKRLPSLLPSLIPSLLPSLLSSLRSLRSLIGSEFSGNRHRPTRMRQPRIRFKASSVSPLVNHCLGRPLNTSAAARGGETYVTRTTPVSWCLVGGRDTLREHGSGAMNQR